jgi:hypothetical protein
LGERVVDISGHSIAFGQNGGLPAPLADFGEPDGQHHLVGECLGKLDLLGLVWPPFCVAHCDHSSDAPFSEDRH